MGVWDGLKRSCRSLGGLQRDRMVKAPESAGKSSGGNGKLKWKKLQRFLRLK